jgi:hypothetical protein
LAVKKVGGAVPDASCAVRSGSRGKTSRPHLGRCKSTLR